MATVKFYLQSLNEAAPVYCRLSLGRGKTPKCKTGFTCNPSDWSKKKGLPIGRDEKTKALKNQLNKLNGQLLEAYNTDQAKGVQINTDWLKATIDQIYNRKAPEQLEYLTTYAKNFIENIAYKVSDKGKIGVSATTLKKYQTILNKLKAFEQHKKKRYLIKEVNLNFRRDLIKYLVEVDGLNQNTTGRYIKFVKTFVLDAQKNGQEVHPQIQDFKGFTVKAEKVILSFDELEQIAQTPILNEKLEAARDWLIIGAYTGQRVSDLLRMSASMLRQYGEFKVIELTQKKTGKTVQIPLHPKVQAILNKRNGQFPKSFAKKPKSAAEQFNRYLKKVCKAAGIDEPTQGTLKKEGPGTYPKWQLITSHVCRRSFATNFYATNNYPTPLLMNITAHSTEKMFLEYIGKPPLDYSLQLAKQWSKDFEGEVLKKYL